LNGFFLHIITGNNVRDIRCIETRGNIPGGMSYFLKTARGWIVFSGDVMMFGARMHNWFDTEWDYGFASGLYAIGFDALRVDRALHEGEKIRWQGYELTVDWLPGQTECAMYLYGMIDNIRVAFTGDNIFADPDNPSHKGNEALVSRNSSILEEGYKYGAE
jgi:glyoxylase-like metal-dependent hydrolase (beta-lactamase superfamily II)